MASKKKTAKTTTTAPTAQHETGTTPAKAYSVEISPAMLAILGASEADMGSKGLPKTGNNIFRGPAEPWRDVLASFKAKEKGLATAHERSACKGGISRISLALGLKKRQPKPKAAGGKAKVDKGSVHVVGGKAFVTKRGVEMIYAAALRSGDAELTKLAQAAVDADRKALEARAALGKALGFGG